MPFDPSKPFEVESTRPAKPMSDTQSNAALFADRMREANKILLDRGVDYEGASVPGNMLESAEGWPGIGAIANSMQTDRYQSYEQARRDFVNAVLRKESGAAISEGEFSNAVKQYFPRIGDSDTTVEQKRRNRETAIEGLTRAAGPLYKPGTHAPSMLPAASSAPQSAPKKPKYIVEPVGEN